MARRSGFKRADVRLAALLLGTICIPSAFALAQGGPPPGPDQGQGRPPFGGPPRFGGGQRGASVAQIPVSALTAALNLTADQKSKIDSIQKDAQQQRRSLMTPPDQGAGGPPDPEQMRANFDKMRSLDQQTKANIEAVLTDDQKQALPGFLKEVETYRSTGIPLEVYGDLKLTVDQKQQIAAVAKKAQQDMQAKMEAARQSGDFQSMRSAMDQNRQTTHAKAMAVLTADQRATVKKYMDAHPRPQGGPGGPGGFGGPGGPGGPGGFGPGGPGGPPPGGPDGGPGGPPPPPNGDGGNA